AAAVGDRKGSWSEGHRRLGRREVRALQVRREEDVDSDSHAGGSRRRGALPVAAGPAAREPEGGTRNHRESESGRRGLARGAGDVASGPGRDRARDLPPRQGHVVVGSPSGGEGGGAAAGRATAEEAIALSVDFGMLRTG